MKIVAQNAAPAVRGPVDRREIARDLFREHLDLDRISRVIQVRNRVDSAATGHKEPASAKPGP